MQSKQRKYNTILSSELIMSPFFMCCSVQGVPATLFSAHNSCMKVISTEAPTVTESFKHSNVPRIKCPFRKGVQLLFGFSIISLFLNIKSVAQSAWKDPIIIKYTGTTSHRKNRAVDIGVVGMRGAPTCVAVVGALRRGDVQTGRDDVIWLHHRLAETLFICWRRLKGK